MPEIDWRLISKMLQISVTVKPILGTHNNE